MAVSRRSAVSGRSAGGVARQGGSAGGLDSVGHHERMSPSMDFKSRAFGWNCFMRITRLIVPLVLLFTSGLGAQNPPAPAATAPRLDTPQARVVVATLQPRTPSIAQNG